MSNLSVIVLTYNEERHLARCLESVARVASSTYVIDSFSTDRTREIASRLGAVVLTNPWSTHADQVNWALENCPIDTDWVLRLDADEYLLPELADEIERKLPELGTSVTGIMLKRRVFFMGRWIRHGGYYPVRFLRLWRHGAAVCERRWIDEHMALLRGEHTNFDHDFVDHNLGTLSDFVRKHDGYSTRECVELLGLGGQTAALEELGGQVGLKRWLREHIYYRAPRTLRAGLYFFLRYVLRGGFLDGREGAIFHFLQGFWFRLLCDAKAIDVERRARASDRTPKQVLAEDYALDVEKLRPDRRP